MRLFSPLLRIFEVAIITPAVHLLVGPTSSITSSDIVTSNQLKLLIESSRQRGLISDDENKLLAEVVEIGFLKVRHVLQPRVDMVSCDVTEPVKNIQMLMIENNIIKIPVYEEEIDNIIGCLYQRDLLLFPNKHITELVKKINFIPEQKTVE